jgi:hypothetical protein
LVPNTAARKEKQGAVKGNLPPVGNQSYVIMTSLCGGLAEHGNGTEVLGVGSMAPSGGPERRGPEKGLRGWFLRKPLGRLVGRLKNRGTEEQRSGRNSEVLARPEKYSRVLGNNLPSRKKYSGMKLTQLDAHD